MTEFNVFIASPNLVHGTVSLVSICWSSVYCCGYRRVLCFVLFGWGFGFFGCLFGVLRVCVLVFFKVISTLMQRATNRL